MFKCGGSIDQASVEKDPTRGGLSDGPVGEGHLHRTPGKGDAIHPGQRPATALQFLGNNSSTWLADRGKTSSSKLCHQRRFTAAGTA